MTSKEKAILAWNFEELLRNLISGYIELDKFNIFETHIVVNDNRYNIKIEKEKEK